MMLFLLLSAVLMAVRAVLVPTLPGGPFPVAVRVQDLTDASRLDPYAPKDKPHHRRIVVSVFMPLEPRRPACAVEVVPYLPPRTAAVYNQVAASIGFPNDTFSPFELELCKLSSVREDHYHDGPRYPIVVFSPGLSASRLIYSAGAKALASRGHVVITVDHPYDSAIVEFPDGSVVLGVNITGDKPENILHAIQVRAADVSFIIDQLHNSSARRQLTAGLPGSVDLKKVIVYGHSLGGATAAAAMLTDDRILGGLNFDGHVYGPVVDRGLDHPFVQAGVPGHASMPGSHWPELYSHLRSAKIEVAVSDTAHLSFSDISLLATAMNISDKLKPTVDAYVGTVNGRRMQLTMVGILTAFVDFVFEGKAEGLRNLGQDLCGVSVVQSQLPNGP